MSTWYVMSDSLSHHGVKGMKWGVRKAERRLAIHDRNTSRGKGKYASNNRKKFINKAANYANSSKGNNNFWLYKKGEYLDRHREEYANAILKDIKMSKYRNNKDVQNVINKAIDKEVSSLQKYQKRDTAKAIKQIKDEEKREQEAYKKKTASWSETQKRVYNSTGKFIDEKNIKNKSNGSVVVDMGGYELIYNPDGSTTSRPKKR